MLYFFVRGDERITYEIRLAGDGSGYELVIARDGAERIERFPDLHQLRARERELMALWSALGWTDVVSRR